MAKLKVGDRVNVYGGIPGITRYISGVSAKGTVVFVNEKGSAAVRLDEGNKVFGETESNISYTYYGWQLKKLKAKVAKKEAA